MNISGPPHPPSFIPDRSERPALDHLTGAILECEPFIAMTGEDASERSAVLEAAIACLEERAVRFLRVGNKLSAPLTVGRVMLQLGVDDYAGDVEDEVERLLDRLTRRLDSEEQVVLAVEAADTLQPQALSFLQLVPGVRREGSPLLQVLFVGRPDFWALLQAPALEPIRDQLVTWIELGAPELPAAAPHVMPEIAMQATAVPNVVVADVAARPLVSVRRRGRALAAAVAGVAGLTAAGLLAAGFFYRGLPYSRAPAPSTVDKPAALAKPAAQPDAVRQAASAAAGDGRGLDATARQPTPAPVSAPPAVPDQSAAPPQSQAMVVPVAPQSLPDTSRARLRHEFDAFLDRSGPAGLTEEQRELLFQQYIERHGGAQAVPSAPTATAVGPPGPLVRRVVIRFQAGSASGEAEAKRLAAALGPDAARAETRAARNAPKEPTVQFYHPEDEAAATAVAADLRGAGGDWRVRDLTAHRPRPSRGTIGVWVPQQ